VRHFGWHTFRHTHATLLKGNSEDVKVVQELKPISLGRNLGSFVNLLFQEALPREGSYFFFSAADWSRCRPDRVPHR